MLVEVEDNIAEVGRLANKVLAGADRKSLLKLIKKEHPDMPLPEIDADLTVEAATASMRAEIEALKADKQKEQSLKNLEARRASVPHLKGEALARVEKFMVENGVSSYEIADREIQRLDQAAAPRSAHRFGRMEMPTPDKDNLLFTKPSEWRNRTLHNMVDDLKAGRQI